VGKGVQSGVDVKTGSGVEGFDVNACVGGTIVSDGNGLGVTATPGIVAGGIWFDEQPTKNKSKKMT